jgi:transposase
VKKQTLQRKYTQNPLEMQVVMPLDLGMRIGMSDKVRTLIEVTERMDYGELTNTYQRSARLGEATPRQMYQIVLLGFMDGRYSTREIESCCRNDIRFIWLLSGNRAPEHSKIARFIKDHLYGEVAENLFYQMVLLLKERGEIAFENLYVDGTKIEANANRYSFVWAKAVSKYEVRCDEKIAQMLKELTVRYAIVRESAQEYAEALEEIRQRQDVEFVQGRGCRKSALQKDIEALGELLERKALYAQNRAILKGRGRYSKSDHDATFMRMKEDHMKNGQLKPGYNLQLGVENEYIVGADISQERSDELALAGLLRRMDKYLLRRHKSLTTDAGYESEENYKLLEERGQAAFIKPQNYERSKTRKYQGNAFLRENMPYDSDTDTYTCPAGQTFKAIGEKTRKSRSGFEAAVTIYECFACEGCPQKALCTKAKDNRRMEVSKDFLALCQASLERITSEDGKILRLNRSIQSEGAFGVLKEDYGFRRFLRRGALNVFTEALLYATAYNVNKLHGKILRAESGCTLHRQIHRQSSA